MPEQNIIGRKNEKETLKGILKTNQAEFLAIYGRRRVGKTFLIREFFSNKGLYFEITGQKDGSIKEQLENFSKIFSNIFLKGISIKSPENWKNAFELLTNQIKKLDRSKKIIFFLDELPWLSNKKSKLMQALDYYWNRFWSTNKNFILIVCGSAASWMLDNLINAKGGLYNRLTRIIHLRPFYLKETKQYLISKNIHLSEKQICDIYMSFGGIPYYLNQIIKGKSATQIINKVCFQKEGILYDEFDKLLAALYDQSDVHYLIIKKIAKTIRGISRENLIKQTKLSSGGRLNKRLKELEISGFIQSYVPYGNKIKNQFYRITDEYILFYFHWILPIKRKGIQANKSYWKAKARTPAVLSWAGNAFEIICLKHVDKILQALDLESISCEVGSWRYLPKKGEKETGAQIDLLFDREDGVITICEIKYSDTQFKIDKSYAKQLINKIDIFEKYFPTKKQINVAMITMNGIKPTVWSEELVQNEVIFSDLFT
ncbi:MAG: hypothetical protein KR126chlam4_00286 [Candidatus Anoxychlamydiales bacterium]|nr:hypothetical protein [Candidatus Anoxychlamydiales bacterium]NGX40464.1 hypothetical protein [Candidatus Anoxychlamydiales bacterium]HEU64877.1 AAA family ATPase [Chlamydiota bacterium]